ncbi:hypothetical protein SGFS_008910 [Streptomyces graminofaciens]|uniref:Uncharacterized protein n=1 Tax=Streptomyces graminofaciens TaxID=68212 RepID=A0ABM7F1G5_9ACTN|nr:hypothetical protein [Streptomyces graminofaciens]BBC29597.1 hypothetical protein SGFS_008910 [Streptomyces graminofaciens]
MFDLRTEAEMRLHSEKTARELALQKQREDGSVDAIAARTPSQAGEVPETDETSATEVE